MPYTTPALVRTISPGTTEALAPDLKIAPFIAAAEVEVNEALGGRYALPIAGAIPASVELVTRWLAAVYTLRDVWGRDMQAEDQLSTAAALEKKAKEWLKKAAESGDYIIDGLILLTNSALSEANLMATTTPRSEYDSGRSAFIDEVLMW